MTVETFKTFESVKKYIFIDDIRQKQTLVWLENAQKLENGCFKSNGKPVTNQDGDNDLHFTASTAIALLESDYSLGKSLLNSAMECLKTASKSEQTISEEVLMLYSFTLANMEEYSKPLLEKMMKKSKIEGGLIYWGRDDMPSLPKYLSGAPPHAAAEVWLSSYMLLSIMRQSKVTPEDLTTAAKISTWLVHQQNSHGGFRSTRDTAVAIQAMAAVAKHLYVPNSQQTVTIRQGNDVVSTFNLNQDNRLVPQRQVLPNTKGDYVIDVSGRGWCIIQTTKSYNIPVPKENSVYKLSISTSLGDCINGVAYKISLNCKLSYNGNRNESGMAIVKIRMISGYTADYSSLGKLMREKTISKFEQNPKEVILYMENVPKEPLNFSFNALMGQRVLNIKSSFAMVYSYYEQSENGHAPYSHPCAATK